MDVKRPLLSICIPTFNRCGILREALEHYVSDPGFDEEVELVISDNASSDGTEQLCLDYSARYPNIRYHRNSENIQDQNFVRVLDLAQGEYLKLFNDWVYCPDGALRFMTDIIRENISAHKPLFFTSDTIFTKYKAAVFECHDLNDYVRVVSTFVTYNNIFGVWSDQWERMEDKRKYAALQLQQVDWSYQLVAAGGGCRLYNQSVFSACPSSLGCRGGYNWFQVHLDNYYQIMGPYIEAGLISPETFREDRKNLLNHFKRELGLALFGNYSKEWRFDTKGTWSLLWKYYKNDAFFYYYLIEIFVRYIYYFFREKI